MGGSYGGGIQLVAAGIDQRIDAIVPGIAWNSLNVALYPDEQVKTAWGAILTLDLVENGARINTQIYDALVTGLLFGTMSENVQAMLASSGPTVLVDSITAPTLLVQGTADGLFVLEQSVTNAEQLDANGIPTKMIWYCGGHGVCLDPVNPAQTDIVVGDTLAWLNQYVKGEMPPEALDFQYFDQNGDHFSSDLLPFEAGFIDGAIDASGDGGFLPLLPVIGGSGPQSIPGASGLLATLVSFALAAEAGNALNLKVEAPAETTQVVGAPELSFTYSGFGTAGAVYGQLVDDETGLVLGNLVKPVPVTLNGQTHTVIIDLENVVYRMEPGDSATLQITSSATAYENFAWGAWGWINVSDVELSLPTVADGVATLESAGPLAPAA